MKHLVLSSALIFAGYLGAVTTVEAAERGCEPSSAALTRAEAGSVNAGGLALRLDGDEAERFFDYLNDKVGRGTDYEGDAVIIGRYPALGYDSVAIVDDGCVDETKMIRLDPQTTERALDAAQRDSD